MKELINNQHCMVNNYIIVEPLPFWNSLGKYLFIFHFFLLTFQSQFLKINNLTFYCK